jgi:hypothetical protein
MPDYLCYFEIHVDNRTFREHALVFRGWAQEQLKALESLSEQES